MTFDYDLFVIGGGSGGVRAARIAAGEYGARVALAEESRMGGTCVIRGCVPKKLMIFASQAEALAAEARGFGWTQATAGLFDWQAFRHKLDGELTRLEGAYTGGLACDDPALTALVPRGLAIACGPRPIVLPVGLSPLRR